MTPELTPEKYAEERAICDKAQAFWKANADYSRSGWSSLSKEKATHPDYAACSNEMRGRVEQFELLTNPPERFSAYIGSDGRTLTVWTGQKIGTAQAGRSWPSGSRFCGVSLVSYVCTMAGRTYHGRGQGAGMLINLRETAASKRKRTPKVGIAAVRAAMIDHLAASPINGGQG